MTSTTPTKPGRTGVELAPDYRSIRVAALLVIVGEVLYAVVTPLWHPGGNPDPIGEFGDYAASQSWTLVHSLQFASAAPVAFGLLALARGIDADSAARRQLARFASAAAVAGLALSGVLYAVDGVALKEAANAWVSGPPAAQPALLAVVEGIRGIEWGLRGYADYTTGLTFLLLAAAIAVSAQLPRASGYLLGLIGLLYIGHGVGYDSSASAISNHSLLGTTTYGLVVLVLVWAIWLAITAWRPAGQARHRPKEPTADPA